MEPTKIITRQMSAREQQEVLSGWDRSVDFYRYGTTQVSVIINGTHYSVERFPVQHRNYPNGQPIYRAVYRVNGKRVSKNNFYGVAA